MVALAKRMVRWVYVSSKEIMVTLRALRAIQLQRVELRGQNTDGMCPVYPFEAVP